MPKVTILPPEVISKIAAGEVVERPASVIKEMLENSLDAGATSIEINCEDAGKKLIHIRDNGSGIERADLEKLFNRHATSKIKNADDLFNIHSLGFRGEALYSIGAVADVVLKSKTAQQKEGWEIHLRGSQRIGIKPCSFNQTGTDIEVKELFFNTPARRKFLKTNTTEVQQILSTIIPYTLLYPAVRFVVNHQSKSLLDLSAAKTLKSRVAEVLSLDEKNLLETDQDLSQQNVKLHLILGDINIKRPRRDLQFIFVNDRPVQNKNISFHLNQIYRLIMPDELYPFFVVQISVPATDIDVNIHPTKREVKLQHESELCGILRAVTEQTIMSGGQIKKAGMPGVKITNLTTQALSQTGRREVLSDKVTPDDNSFQKESSSYGTRHDYAMPKSPELNQVQEFFVPFNQAFVRQEDTLQSKLEKARTIGAFQQKYLLFESGSSLLVIDQHAAAERINYEMFIRQMDRRQIEVQHLLTPVLLKLNARELLIWEEAKEKLDEIGLSSHQFDRETIAIQTHPLLIKNVEKAVRDLLAGDNVAQCDHDTIARRACRASVMAGDKLNQPQAEYQREQLLQCLDPFTCPHGRPTVIELTGSFLDKQFLRT